MLCIRGNMALKTVLRSRKCVRYPTHKLSLKFSSLDHSDNSRRPLTPCGEQQNHTRDGKHRNLSSQYPQSSSKFRKLLQLKQTGQSVMTFCLSLREMALQKAKITRSEINQLLTPDWVFDMNEFTVTHTLNSLSKLGYDCSRDHDRNTVIFLLDKFLSLGNIKVMHLHALFDGFAESNMQWHMIPDDLQIKLMDNISHLHPTMSETQASIIICALKQLGIRWAEMPMDVQHGLLRACFPPEDSLSLPSRDHIVTTELHFLDKTSSSLTPLEFSPDGVVYPYLQTLAEVAAADVSERDMIQRAAVARRRAAAVEPTLAKKEPYFHNFTILALARMKFDIFTMADSETRNRIYTTVSDMLNACSALKQQENQVNRSQPSYYSNTTTSTDVSREISSIMIGISTVGVKFDQLPQHLQVAVMRMIETVMHTVDADCVVHTLSSLARLHFSWSQVPAGIRTKLECIVAHDLAHARQQEFRYTIFAFAGMRATFDTIESELQRAISENFSKHVLKMTAEEISTIFHSIGLLQMDWRHFPTAQWSAVEDILVTCMPEFSVLQLTNIVHGMRRMSVQYHALGVELQYAIERSVGVLSGAHESERETTVLLKSLDWFLKNTSTPISALTADGLPGNSIATPTAVQSVFLTAATPEPDEVLNALMAHIGTSVETNTQFLKSVIDMKDMKWHEMDSSFQKPVYHAINTVFDVSNAASYEAEKLDLLTKTLIFLSKSEIKWSDLPSETQTVLNGAIVTHGPKSPGDLACLIGFQAEMGQIWQNMPQKMQQFITNGFTSAVLEPVSVPVSPSSSSSLLSPVSSPRNDFAALLTNMNALGVDWKAVIGNKVDFNTSVLRKIVDIHSTIKPNSKLDPVLAELIHRSLAVAYAPIVIRESASLVGGKDAHRQLFLESLQTLGEVVTSSPTAATAATTKTAISRPTAHVTTPWSEMSVLGRNVLQKALHEYQSFSSRETASLLKSLSIMGVQWYTVNDDIKYTVNRCLKQENSYSALTIEELCSTIHSLAKMKIYWSDIPNLGQLKQSLTDALRNMTPQQVVQIVSDLTALETTWMDLSSHVLLPSLGPAIRAATYQLNLQDLTKLMYNVTVLSFDDPGMLLYKSSTTKAQSPSISSSLTSAVMMDREIKKIHADLLRHFVTLTKSENSVTVPVVDEYSGVYFQYLSGIPSGREIMKKYTKFTVQQKSLFKNMTSAMNSQSGCSSSAHKSLLQKELRSLGPQYTVDSQISKLNSRTLPVDFAVNSEDATVALIDAHTAAAFNGEKEILSRTEQLKAYLYQKQCPKALYYTFKIASENDIKTVATEIITHVSATKTTPNSEFVSMNQQVGLRSGCQSKTELVDSVSAGSIADYATVTPFDLGNSSEKNEVFLLNLFELNIISKWHEMESSFQTPVYHAINTVFGAEHLTQAVTDGCLQEKTDLLLKTLSFLSRHGAQWADLPTDIQSAFNRVLSTLSDNNTVLSSDELRDLIKCQITLGVKWKKLPEAAQTLLWRSVDALFAADAVQDNKAALSELIPLMTEMGIKWADYLGSDVKKNLSFLQTLLSTQSASIASSNSSDDDQVVKQQMAKAACGALTNLINNRETIQTSIGLLSRGENQLKALFLQTLHMLGNSGLKWEQIHSNHRVVLLQSLRDFHLLSYHDNTISFMNALAKLGITWVDMHGDFKLPLTRALTSIGGVMIQRNNKITTHQLCDLIHACAEIKIPWTQLPRTENFKERLMSTIPTMSDTQFHRFLSDLVALEVSLAKDLGTTEGVFMTPFKTAVESVTANCGIQDLTNLMYNFTILTFDDPSATRASVSMENSQALQCHHMFLSRIASLQAQKDSVSSSFNVSPDQSVHPTMNEKTAIYFQYLSTSDLLSRLTVGTPGEMMLSQLSSETTVSPLSGSDVDMATHIKECNDHHRETRQLFPTKEVNEAHKSYLINAFATLAPAGDYSVSSQQSRLFCRSLCTDFTVFYQRKPVAFIDTQVASCFNGKRYILSRMEQLKAYLYHKQCPNALYFPLQKCDDEVLTDVVNQVSEHVNTTVRERSSTTTFTVPARASVINSSMNSTDRSTINSDTTFTALKRSVDYFNRNTEALSVAKATKTQAHINSVMRDHQSQTKGGGGRGGGHHVSSRKTVPVNFKAKKVKDEVKMKSDSGSVVDDLDCLSAVPDVDMPARYTNSKTPSSGNRNQQQQYRRHCNSL